MTSGSMIANREARRARGIIGLAREFRNPITIVQIMKEAAGP